MKKRIFSFFVIAILGLFLASCGKKLEIKFDTDGGDQQIESLFIKKGGLLTKPDDPTKEGYIFLYWKEYTAENPWDFQNDKAEKDTTLYAYWSEDPNVLVKFEGEGITLEPVTLEKGKKLTIDQPKREGYKFINWQVKGTNDVWNLNNAVTKNITLVAVWEVDNNITVRFQGDAVEIPAMLLQKGDKIERPENPFKEGSVFVDWFEEGATEPFDFSKELTKNVTLVAQYRDPTIDDAVAFIGDEPYYSLGLALKAAKANDVILLTEGTITQDVVIEVHNLTLKPVEGAKVVIKSVISFGVLSGLTIEGLEFTEGAYIHGNNYLDNFVFKNNKVYDSTVPSSGYLPNNRSDVNAFIRLYYFKLEDADIVGNVTITGNEFINMSSDIISIARTKYGKEINISDNIFKNYATSAIRFDGGYNSGTYNILRNTFEHDVKGGAPSAITFRCYAPSAGYQQIINIKENNFINVGNSSLDYDNTATGYPGSGVIVFSTFNDQNTKVYINDNLFKNTTRAIHFRNAGKADDLSADFSNNTFENNDDYYLYQVRTKEHPAPEANFQNGLFKDAEGNIITDLTVIGTKIINNNSYNQIRTTED